MPFTELKVDGTKVETDVGVNSFSSFNAMYSICVCSSNCFLFRYTVDTDFLSPEQRIAYEEDGFILIKNLVSEEDIDKFR